MKTKHLLPSVLAVIAFAACDSRQENQRENALEQKADRVEDQADAVRKDSERKADAIEDTKQATSGQKKAIDDTADAVRKSGERTADSLENTAEATREAK